MQIEIVRDTAMVARRWSTALGVMLLAATPLSAQTAPTLPPVTFGAGVQTSFVSTSPQDTNATNDFALNSVRLYVNGPATNTIKFMFNTEYDGASNRVTVLDAVARFEPSERLNVWVGRFLPPSDRANLYGPYYAHHWNVYADGVQDGYPFVATGRDNGAAYWGQFGIMKVSAGAFDGSSATGNSKLIGAARVQLDFWDPEAGYYLNGTYYGSKNLLAIGAAAQAQDGNRAYSGDFLLERKVAAGSVTVEAELAKYDKLGGYNARYGSDAGGYVLGSYLFPPMDGLPGQFEVLGKFAKANFRNGLTVIDADYDQKTTEVNFNYVIREFKARVMVFFKNTTFSSVHTDFKQAGVGIQLQM